MPENQAPETPSRILAEPPGLRQIGTDAAGVCADGHCVLPSAPSTSVEGDQAGADAEDAGASGSDTD